MTQLYLSAMSTHSLPESRSYLHTWWQFFVFKVTLSSYRSHQKYVIVFFHTKGYIINNSQFSILWKYFFQFGLDKRFHDIDRFPTGSWQSLPCMVSIWYIINLLLNDWSQLQNWFYLMPRIWAILQKNRLNDLTTIFIGSIWCLLECIYQFILWFMPTFFDPTNYI